jgi:F0F1-type ATP synthase membrane subunit b/b'
MTIRFNTYDYDALFGAFTTFFIIMAGFAILVWTIFYFIKNPIKTNLSSQHVQKSLKKSQILSSLDGIL